MTVHFTYTVEDLVAWNLYRLYQTPAGRRYLLRFYVGLALFAWLVVSSLLLWLYGAKWGIGAFTAFSAGALVGYSLLVAVLAAVTGRSGMARATRRLIKKGRFPHIKGEIAVTPRPDGWHSAWADGEMLRKWEALRSVTEKDGSLVLHWSEDDFSLLPAHAFASAEESRAFLAEIERQRQAPVTPQSAIPPVVISAVTAPQWYRDRNQVEVETQSVRNGSPGAP